MPTEFQPAGGTGPAQRPAASAHGDNSKAAMSGSGKASESKPTTNLGAALTGIYNQAQPGTVVNESPVAKSVDFVPTPDGKGGNIASEDVEISKSNEVGPNGGRVGVQGKAIGGTSGTHSYGALVSNTMNQEFKEQPLRGGKKGA